MKKSDVALIVDALSPVLRDFVREALAPLGARVKAIEDAPRPQDGKSVTLDDVRPLIEQAVAALPRPKDGEDGKSVTLDDVAPLIEETTAKAVAALPKPRDGKDGIGLAGALIGRDGNLVVTLSDGTTKDLGRVVGKDGDPGLAGLGFDDLAVTHDGERGFTFAFVRGDQRREFAFTLPVVLDRGVFKEGNEYKSGDGVTWGGSFWIAQKDTADKPGTDAWRLAVKKGRDGKDGRDLSPPPPAQVKVG
jgi:hypothetical protein